MTSNGKNIIVLTEVKPMFSNIYQSCDNQL